MAKTFKRNPRYTTDKGVAVYPHLVTADTKFNAEGEYHCKVRLPADAKLYDEKRKVVGTVQAIIDEQIEAAREQFAKQHEGKTDKRGRPVEVTEADPPIEIDGNEILVKVKLKAQGKTRDGEVFTQAPVLFDAKGKKITPERLWNGSIIKPAFEIVPYFNAKDKVAGVTLRLKAVQVIELVSSSAPGADAFGFGEEDGYEGEEEEDYGDSFGGGDDEEEGQTSAQTPALDPTEF